MRSLIPIPFISLGNKPQRMPQAFIWLVVLFAVSCITVLQDYLQAQRNGYGFYLSESALFNIFWLLYLPVAALLLKGAGQLRPTANRPILAFRTLAFVGLASLLHMLLFASTVYGLSALCFNHTYTPVKLLSYTISEDMSKYVLIYGAIAWIRMRRRKAPKPTNCTLAEKPTLTQIIVGTGLKQITIPTDTILFIAAASPYIAIHTTQKKHLHTCTLKTIESQLDADRFVRIHKSTIVNLQSVLACHSRLNGDYDLELHNGQQLRLSRHYVAAFRQRFGNG